MKMGNQEQAVVKHEIGRRHRQQHAGHSADDERHHETDRPQHRRRIVDAAAIHREQPVEDLHAGRHGDDHRGNAEHRIDVGAGAHREEVMQPHHEGENADHHGGRDHRAIAEQRLPAERRDHLGKDAERRQRENIDLRMSPCPDQVHEHHDVAAGFIGEKMEAEIAIEQQHRQRRCENRKRRNNQQVRCKRRPAEHRHAQIAHALCPRLENGRHHVDAVHERSDTGNLDRPQVVVDAYAR